jgi:hypothetical protein
MRLTVPSRPAAIRPDRLGHGLSSARQRAGQIDGSINRIERHEATGR